MKERLLIIDDCELEWNRVTGVLYVHNKRTGHTLLRISGLPSARETVTLGAGQMIDVRVTPEMVSSPIA